MIDVQSLVMRYGSFKALDDVSFKASEKEIVGLLGPNGAGKTTAMRIITTYLHPFSGTVKVNGVDALENPIEVRRHIGYLPETAPLYPDMQVDEYVRFVGASRGLKGNTLGQRIKWVKEACNLGPVWKHTINELSKGYRQRVGLAQALLHDPKVLILDEPTSGLDPLQVMGIRDLIRELAKEKTIIFSTHILQEVEAVAGRIVIINEGKVVSQGTQKELEAEARSLGETAAQLNLEKIFIALLTQKKRKKKE
jgi:ABC-2 type transport system ATP-binding protein